MRNGIITNIPNLNNLNNINYRLQYGLQQYEKPYIYNLHKVLVIMGYILVVVNDKSG